MRGLADRFARTPRCLAEAVGGMKGGSRFGPGSLIIAGGLLILPVMALARLPFVWWMEWGYAAAVSGVAYLMNVLDKKRARAGQWRIAEATLHLLELAGGWPGALLAQRWCRHKCSKVSYQIVFWLIVAAYELLAFDFLRDWAWARGIAEMMQTLPEPRRLSRGRLKAERGRDSNAASSHRSRQSHSR
ncbi:MAG: DUF1294 domain-containing protein [Chthoniobacter sp.]|uniref:DUF1294 domain-containing protein n=1 Tax=Chthoniobacter sp. TaxID=2510640 RepID=UPI0032A7F75F